MKASSGDAYSFSITFSGAAAPSCRTLAPSPPNLETPGEMHFRDSTYIINKGFKKTNDQTKFLFRPFSNGFSDALMPVETNVGAATAGAMDASVDAKDEAILVLIEVVGKDATAGDETEIADEMGAGVVAGVLPTGVDESVAGGFVHRVSLV
jgi:hypothetical protein